MSLLALAVFVVIYLHGLFGRALLADSLGVPVIVAATVGPMLLLWLVFQLLMLICGRLIDRRGSIWALHFADAALVGFRAGVVVVHALGVLLFGWLETVRSYTGDLVLADELIAATPALAFFLLGWWSIFPLERRYHDAVTWRMLSEGKPVAQPLARVGFVLAKLRNQLLVAALPVSLIMGWGEASERAFRYVARDNAEPSFLFAGVQLLGVLAIIAMLPALLRVVWDTVPLGPGPLRDRIERACRAHGVRFREILVWRTHGLIANGAVLGAIGPLRYVLLTDRLLESLPLPHVEAVAAHEVAHVRRRHLPWLACAAVATGMLVGVLGDAIYELLTGSPELSDWRAIFAVAFAFTIVLLVFGYVSRRFEWQADAFAAAHLTRSLAPDGAAPDAVSPEAADLMRGSLQAVAELNGMSIHRFSFRHGSIASRQRKLMELVGRRLDALPIDRQVRRIKLASLLLLVACAAVYAHRLAGTPGPTAELLEPDATLASR